MESLIENKRLTPNWIIQQQVAMEQYSHLVSIEHIVCKIMEESENIGLFFFRKKLWSESCLILDHFFEFCKEIVSFLSIADNREKEIIKFKIDQQMVWESSELARLKRIMTRVKNKLPVLLSKSSSQFTESKNYNTAQHPDYIGSCFNRLCYASLNAIINNDTYQFKIIFSSIFKLLIPYNIFINKDININKKGIDNISEFLVCTHPIIYFAQIAGLAIIWGEFNQENTWLSIIRSITNCTNRNAPKKKLKERLANIINIRKILNAKCGYYTRTIMHTEMNQIIENAIRESKLYNLTRDQYGTERLKTNSKILKEYCRNFPRMGFSEEPEEIYLEMCLTPLDEKCDIDNPKTSKNE